MSSARRRKVIYGSMCAKCEKKKKAELLKTDMVAKVTGLNMVIPFARVLCCVSVIALKKRLQEMVDFTSDAVRLFVQRGATTSSTLPQASGLSALMYCVSDDSISCKLDVVGMGFEMHALAYECCIGYAGEAYGGVDSATGAAAETDGGGAVEPLSKAWL